MRKLLTFLLAATLVAGCSENDDGPRELSFPTFRAEEPIPELGASGERMKRPGDSAPADDSSKFDEEIQQAMGGNDEENSNEESSSENVTRQAVLLGGMFAADVPAEYDEWQWARDHDTTLIVHKKAGESPDALIYAQKFQDLGRRHASLETVHFQMTVDPDLVKHPVLPGLLSTNLKETVSETSASFTQTIDALLQATSPTLGFGLNYRSAPRSFSGWKWVGRNEHDVEMRFARTDGDFYGAPVLDRLSGEVLDSLSEQIEPLGKTADAYRKLVSDKESAQPEDANQAVSSPAWMLLGNAAQRRDTGLHLAVICKKEPNCPVANELATMLDSLRRPNDGTTLAQPTHDDLLTFATEMNLPFVAADNLLSPDEVANIVRKLGEKKEEEDAQNTESPGAAQQ